MIPEPFRVCLGDIAYRMQCPLDFVATGAIVMTGSLIGAGCGIKPKRYDDWLVIPNLWGGFIARPGMLKTPAMAEAFKPLRVWEAKGKGRRTTTPCAVSKWNWKCTRRRGRR